MQKYFEKIIDTLRTESRHAKHCFDFKTASAFNTAITIVNVVFDDMDKGKVSDGYHTFDELYHHRAVLFSVICNTHKELAWKSKLHDTGDMYDGMFIVGIETPEGQATYHYDINPYWDMFDVKELPKAPKWDGHTPDEAIRRIGLIGKDTNVPSNDGWIPVSERLPDEKGEYYVTYHPCYWDHVYDEVCVGFDTFRGKASWAKKKYQRVIAWKPKDTPYQPKGEEQ